MAGVGHVQQPLRHPVGNAAQQAVFLEVGRPSSEAPRPPCAGTPPPSPTGLRRGRGHAGRRRS
eukprot:8429888-Alexandrium_andersonii.AAC.1